MRLSAPYLVWWVASAVTRYQTTSKDTPLSDLAFWCEVVLKTLEISLFIPSK